MRFLLLLAAAIFIALALFEMMFALISTKDMAAIQSDVAMSVNIQAVRAPSHSAARAAAEQASVEPDISEMLMPMPATIAVSSLATQDRPVDYAPDSAMAMEHAFTDSQLGREQNLWIQPSHGTVNADAQGEDYIGERDTGGKEMVPIASRQPLIPKVAWDNKIDGWVLVAFAVNNQGRVEDVRIMDASPRGVFEAHAVSAVQKWRYDSYQGPVKYLSQRIEFLYKNYPSNWGEL